MFYLLALLLRFLPTTSLIFYTIADLLYKKLGRFTQKSSNKFQK